MTAFLHRAKRAVTPCALVALTVVACFDRTTAPPPALAPAPRHDFAGDPNWGANNSATGGVYDGVVDPVYGGAPMGSILGPFVYPTFVTMNVSGQVRQMPGALQGSNIVREAWSTNDPAFWGSMALLNTSNGDRWYPVGPTAVLRIVAPMRAYRNEAGGQPTGDWSHCGWAGYALCWTWSGSAHLDFTSIHVGLTLTQSPDTTVWMGNSATFTAGRSQTYFPPNPYPVDLSALQWRWIPDEAGSADTVACHSFSGETCTRVFTTSGTMYAAAYVNGEAQQKSIHVNVSVPTVTLAASPTTVNEGDNVTFTGTISPSWASASAGSMTWTWQRDDGGIMATRIPLGSASARAALRPAPRLSSTLADADSISSEDGGAPDPVPPTATTSACTTSSLTCQTSVLQKGTMRLTVAFGSVVRTATASVTVHYECRPIYYKGLRVNDFRAYHGSQEFIDWAQLNPVLDFVEDYGFDPIMGYPLGKYRVESGTDSRGYKLVPQLSYVVLTCKDWRKQQPDGSDLWIGTDTPRYGGHHSLHFVPPAP